MSCDGNQQGCRNYWSNLPRDITIMILQKLGVLQILLSAQLVCTEWRNIICTEPSLWSTIRVVDWKSNWTPQLKLDFVEYVEHVENMIRRAVDRSCGTLFDLDLDVLMSQELLHYVVERCTQIRCLRIWSFIEKDIERVASKLSLLENLEFVCYCHDYVSLKTIETLGRYCPRLRSLKIIVGGDEEVKVIARSMPQLRHICVSGVTYVGVETLLDGCPHLESLILNIHGDISTLRGTFQMMKKKKKKKKKLPLSTRTLDKLNDDPCTWSTICVNIQAPSKSNRDNVKQLIRLAVDKSYGGLVDVDLGILMFEDILSYVVERCTQIRRLRGSGCMTSLDCAEKALGIAAPRLPLLENLQLIYYYPSAETIKTLGRCCPRLTSLEIPIYSDEGAKTLARSLPQLRHLKPAGAYALTDVGVETLLDGCPHLESLNLADCNHVRLYGTLRFRCAQQIKHMQRPKQTYCRSYRLLWVDKSI